MFAARHSYDASLSRVVVVSVTFDVVTKPICNRNIQFDALNQDIGPDIVHHWYETPADLCTCGNRIDPVNVTDDDTGIFHMDAQLL